MTHAFDMSRYQRVIDTAETRVRGSFVVQGSLNSGVFKVDPLDVVLYSEDRSWGQGVMYGDFEINVDRDTHVATLGRIRNENKRPTIEDFSDLINEALTVVIAAFEAGGYAEEFVPNRSASSQEPSGRGTP